MTKAEKDLVIGRFCNKGCYGTLFQETEYSNADLEKLLDWCKKGKCDKKMLINSFIKTRKNLLNGRKNMLTDDFYYNINAKKKTELRKNGALSGCTTDVIFF